MAAQELSPSAAAENESNLHPGVRAYQGFGLVVFFLPAPPPLAAPALAPAPVPAAPRGPRPANAPPDPPALTLPRTELRLRLTRKWQFQHGLRRMHAPLTPLFTSPSAKLRWLLVQTWMALKCPPEVPNWWKDLLACHFFVSIFGGLRWSILQAVRACLQSVGPERFQLPSWVRRILDSEAC